MMTENILYRSYFETPYGKMVAMATEQGLSVLEFMKPNRRHVLDRRLNKWFSNYRVVDAANSYIDMAGEWLDCYFQGEFRRLAEPPLDLKGTEFERKVWRGLRNIPLGQTTSYLGLATELGMPKGSRAVGGANGRNPVSIIVPCHRVIGHNKTLVGYGGGLEVKEALISHEKKR